MTSASTDFLPVCLLITILTLLWPNRQRSERRDRATNTAAARENAFAISHGYKVQRQKFLLGAWQDKEDVRIRRGCQIVAVMQALGSPAHITEARHGLGRAASCSWYWNSTSDGDCEIRLWQQIQCQGSTSNSFLVFLVINACVRKIRHFYIDP